MGIRKIIPEKPDEKEIKFGCDAPTFSKAHTVLCRLFIAPFIFIKGKCRPIVAALFDLKNFVFGNNDILKT